MTNADYLSEIFRRTGVVMTMDLARSTSKRIDRDAREMALTYKGLGYSPAAAAAFLRTYYLLETQ